MAEVAFKDETEITTNNPVGEIDQILYDVASGIPISNYERTILIKSSQNLRDIVTNMTDETANINNRSKNEGVTLTQGLGVENTQKILRELGLLGPNDTLENLQSSDRWLSFKNNRIKDGVVGATIAGLDSEIPGVSVVVQETQSSPGRTLGHKFTIELQFAPETMKALALPLPESPFDKKPLEHVDVFI